MIQCRLMGWEQRGLAFLQDLIFILVTKIMKCCMYMYIHRSMMVPYRSYPNLLGFIWITLVCNSLGIISIDFHWFLDSLRVNDNVNYQLSV